MRAVTLRACRREGDGWGGVPGGDQCAAGMAASFPFLPSPLKGGQGGGRSERRYSRVFGSIPVWTTLPGPLPESCLGQTLALSRWSLSLRCLEPAERSKGGEGIEDIPSGP